MIIWLSIVISKIEFDVQQIATFLENEGFSFLKLHIIFDLIIRLRLIEIGHFDGYLILGIEQSLNCANQTSWHLMSCWLIQNKLVTRFVFEWVNHYQIISYHGIYQFKIKCINMILWVIYRTYQLQSFLNAAEKNKNITRN